VDFLHPQKGLGARHPQVNGNGGNGLLHGLPGLGQRLSLTHGKTAAEPQWLATTPTTATEPGSEELMNAFLTTRSCAALGQARGTRRFLPKAAMEIIGRLWTWRKQRDLLLNCIYKQN